LGVVLVVDGFGAVVDDEEDDRGWVVVVVRGAVVVLERVVDRDEDDADVVDVDDEPWDVLDEPADVAEVVVPEPGALEVRAPVVRVPVDRCAPVDDELVPPSSPLSPEPVAPSDADPSDPPSRLAPAAPAEASLSACARWVSCAARAVASPVAATAAAVRPPVSPETTRRVRSRSFAVTRFIPTGSSAAREGALSARSKQGQGDRSHDRHRLILTQA
jgi:hypothetical protein